MITVNCTMMQDKLIGYVEAIEEPKCTFAQKNRMGVDFETTDDAAAAPIVKQTLKATPEFKAVYFQVHVK